MRNKISNRGTVLARVYRREVQGSSSTIQRKGELHHKINAFHPRGILCCHSLSVLSFERVDNVAPKCILERWSKNIKRRHTHIKSSQDEPILEPKSKRFNDLVFQSHNICEFASESEELTGILHRVFDNIMAEMQEYQARSKEKVRYPTKKRC
ncbi:Transposon protein [Arachis hypogaea]|nr:Transposon protein [Arachis hypogaea]